MQYKRQDGGQGAATCHMHYMARRIKDALTVPGTALVMSN
jgi:hypothetical protein